jgi:pimeloyl-ACP methyl ester carboxylesterase
MNIVASALDHVLASVSYRYARTFVRQSPEPILATQSIVTTAGLVCAYDSQGDKPCVIFVPDGPNVLLHYRKLVELLSDRLRVVCFDMPGFGRSIPSMTYSHSLDHGAATVLAVMDALKIETATLAFSCANGLYALRVAEIAPHRISQLVLSQTPTLAAMHAWVDRIIPWPIPVPVLGQLIGWILKYKTSLPWYPKALPRGTDPTPFVETTRHALHCGGCYSLAGVVQGLMAESPESLRGVRTPCTVIWGVSDRSHAVTLPDSLLECVPHAQIVRFEDCGHFPELEQPQRFADLLKIKILGDG